MSDAQENETGVGYGQPPISGQFKKGRSGNIKGRPKKPDPSVVDLDAILNNQVQVNGAPMDVREVELRQQIKKALEPKGSLKSKRYVIAAFEKHGAMKPPDPKPNTVELPSVLEVPWAIQERLLRRGIAPPWSKKVLDAAKAVYLESRDEGDRRRDVAVGYEEWLMT